MESNRDKLFQLMGEITASQNLSLCSRSLVGSDLMALQEKQPDTYQSVIQNEKGVSKAESELMIELNLFIVGAIRNGCGFKEAFDKARAAGFLDRFDEITV